MHYYGDRYRHLYLPGWGYSTENLHQCMPHSDACSTTCHPLSVTKTPMTRWQNYAQTYTYVCPQPSVTQTLPLHCQPYVQQCILLHPEPCETAHLLPCRRFSLSTVHDCQPCEKKHHEKKHTAKSLPPCAPKCPVPGKLKFPPCGLKYGPSYEEECRSHKITHCSGRGCCAEHRSPQGMTNSYSPPLRGVTECPPQPCIMQPLPHENVSRFPPQKCMKGYPTQEYIPSSQQCATKCPPRPQAIKCPPGQAIKECSAQHRAAKCVLPQEGVKHKSSSTHHLTKTKCLYPGATHRSPQHHVRAVKHSSHPRKSRSGSKWLW
ncbi:PREDICTED: uncharacterized protein LOC104471850 [Pterocles gutturalis]|uniref:uncharacterized protein LOC104471850 n=1 Tax=Pterocles gutturalis TaxID=240206 RepID=UPI000528FFBB|nr:PREDICTED: uncharacterized protein LOC104471850 [Pterocles gutturalis]